VLEVQDIQEPHLRLYYQEEVLCMVVEEEDAELDIVIL
jgi:hypothetical protein